MLLSKKGAKIYWKKIKSINNLKLEKSHRRILKSLRKKLFWRSLRIHRLPRKGNSMKLVTIHWSIVGFLRLQKMWHLRVKNQDSVLKSFPIRFRRQSFRPVQISSLATASAPLSTTTNLN
jgi:hypothetical protein